MRAPGLLGEATITPLVAVKAPCRLVKTALTDCGEGPGRWVHGVYPWANKTIGDATLVYALINIVFRLPIFMLGALTAHSVVYRFAFGAAMAIIFRYSQSLWAPIISHSLKDCLSNVIFHI